MPYVERDETGVVKGVYANAQSGYAEEELADDHPDIVAFRNPPPTPMEQRAEALKADTARRDILERLRTSTPTQIDQWYDNNINTVAKRDALMKAILKLIALDARS